MENVDVKSTIEKWIWLAGFCRTLGGLFWGWILRKLYNFGD
jgi:hypothetical protein